MRTIEISKDQWSQLMAELGRARDYTLAHLVLSSDSEKVWLKTKKGYHHEPERTFINILNKYSFINEIHREVLTHDPIGKRFTITEKEVRLADGHVLVCYVKFV